MTDSTTPLTSERRKNAARKKPVDIAYQVVWNEQGRAFQVLRAGEPTGALLRDKNRAIGLAIHDAGRDAQRGLKVVVYSRQDGRQSVEWSS